MSSFLIWMTFISLSCLIALVETSSAILRVVRVYPCFVSDLIGKGFNLSLLSVILAVGLL